MSSVINKLDYQILRINAIIEKNKKSLDDYLFYIEQMKLRNHKKIGLEMDLFSFHSEASGVPFFHNNGMIILNELQKYLRNLLLNKYEYEEIKSPIMMNKSIWELSGHYENYKENMYFSQVDKEEYVIKPINCPGSILVYKSKLRSYKELPCKLFEFGQVHRHESSGSLNGLFRVRSFVQDDAHIFLSKDEIQNEIQKLIKLFFEVYSHFNLKNVQIFMSSRPINSIGEDLVWEIAEKSLINALDDCKINYEINEGDGAFYGPKIDFVVKDSLNRNWQLGTIQLDFSLPERFELEFINKEGCIERPVMIHRAIFGSFERFIGILLEEYIGKLPMWLSPCQIIILPVYENFNEYSESILKCFKDLRVKIDLRNERISKKIKEAEIKKIPYIIIIGEREILNNSISVRHNNISKEYSKEEFQSLIKL